MTTPINNGASYLPTAGEGTVQQWNGMYAATVVNNNDPLGVGRLQLFIPQVLGNAVSSWAVPLGNYYNVPGLGTTVSATFIGGDPAQPSWVGPLDLAPVVIAGTTRVTYSTTAPPTPDVGDIWYEIFVDGAGNQIISAAQVWTFDPVHSTFSWVVKSTQNSDNGAGIGSSKLGQGTVTGGLTGSLAIGTITADNIVAGTITTTQLNATAINGMTISGNTINGATINGVVMNTPSILLNSVGEFFYATVPSTPVVTPSGTGGTVAAGNYYTKITYVNATGETVPSVNSLVATTTGSTSKLTVTAPGAAGNATGYNVYMSTTIGGTYWKQNSTAVAPATAYVQTTPILTSGTSAPTSATGVVNIAQAGNLEISLAPLSGTDAFGNTYTNGFTTYGMGGASINITPGASNIISFSPGATFSGALPYVSSTLFNGGTSSEYQAMVMFSGQQTGSTGNTAVQMFSDSNNGTSNTAHGNLVITGSTIASWGPTSFQTYQPLYINNNVNLGSGNNINFISSSAATVLGISGSALNTFKPIFLNSLATNPTPVSGTSVLWADSGNVPRTSTVIDGNVMTAGSHNRAYTTGTQSITTTQSNVTNMGSNLGGNTYHLWGFVTYTGGQNANNLNLGFVLGTAVHFKGWYEYGTALTVVDTNTAAIFWTSPTLTTTETIWRFDYVFVSTVSGNGIQMVAQTSGGTATINGAVWHLEMM